MAFERFPLSSESVSLSGESSPFARSRPFGVRQAASPASSALLVEVGREAIRADVTRNGLKLPDLPVDIGVIGGILLPPVGTKVVTQSVEAGRAVPRGTAVDLVVAEAGRLPVRIFHGVHPGLANLAVDDVFTQFIQPNQAVKSILTRVTDPADLTDADKEVLTGVLASPNVVLDTTPGTDVAAGFTALLAANLLHG
jgi:hypothetical protein